MAERGYALLAVLWILAGVGSLGLLLGTSSRDAVATARNRIALTRAEWLAEGCLSILRAAMESTLGPAGADVVTPAPLVDPSCSASVEPVGTRLDVNAVDEGTLRRALRTAGVTPSAADSGATRFMLWRDGHDQSTPGGAGTRPGPSRRLVALEQLDRITGRALPPLDGLLTAEPGPVSLRHAPEAVLSVLPGFTPETARVLVQNRARGLHPRSYAELAGWMGGEAGDSLMSALPSLARLSTLQPAAWLLGAEGRAGKPLVRVAVQLRVQRANVGWAPVRRRQWIR